MVIVATKGFYANANDTVFKAKSGDNDIRLHSDYLQKPFLQQSGKTKVEFFSDNQEISLNLSNQAFEMLKSRFDDKDFLTLKNGAIGLSGDANAFVDGWYKDIMQNRNFANADTNGDKIIRDEEFKNLKNDIKDEFNYDSFQDLSGAGTIVLRNIKNTKGYQNSEISSDLSLDDLLSKTIQSDKNYDGNLTRLEIAANGKNDRSGYKNLAIETVKEIFGIDKGLKIIDDPTGEKMALMNGKTVNEVNNYFFGGSSNDDENVVDNSSLNKKDSQIDELLSLYPELRKYYQANPNITKAELLSIKNRQEQIQNYKDNQTNLKESFAKIAFYTNLQA